ncbi:MAG TPA: pirin-like C-terminal cupin domain-containing protein [Candidatus Xenobia bacterium]|jgi:hypothetical protein
MPVVKTDDGAEVRIICGEYQGQKGPARDIAIEPSYLDVSIPAGGTFRHAIAGEHTAFAYVFEGEKAGTLILFSKDGQGVEIEAGQKPMRFLLVSGKPLREPVAWSGPIVMNTHDELALAFRELRAGTFVKHGLKAML